MSRRKKVFTDIVHDPAEQQNQQLSRDMQSIREFRREHPATIAPISHVVTVDVEKEVGGSVSRKVVSGIFEILKNIHVIASHPSDVIDTLRTQPTGTKPVTEEVDPIVFYLENGGDPRNVLGELPSELKEKPKLQN